jgi:hypothetical protein
MNRTIATGLVAAGVALASGGLYREYRVAAAESHQAVLVEAEAKHAQKAHQIEQSIELIYQGARTIALLPSLREVKGGNLPKGKADADGFDRARFSIDTETTVQQIYNNLASNVAVSEVYAVLDGFKPEQGETPFFMFDELIVDAKKAEAGAAEAHHDAPEESEEAEYAYYVGLLADFNRTRPKLDLSTLELNQVPMVSSPAMRTCDNSQYPSTSGDAHNADGILFSVPIYARDQHFVGVISVIARTNVFEAMLVGVESLAVTPEEKAALKRAGKEEPAIASFVLSRPKQPLTIADRRFDLAAARAEEGGELLTRTLELPLSEGWQLEYFVSSSAFAPGLTAARYSFAYKLLAVWLIAGFLLYVLRSSSRRTAQVEAIRTHLEVLSRGQLPPAVNEAAVGELSPALRGISEWIAEVSRGAAAIAAGDLHHSIVQRSDGDLLALSFQRAQQALVRLDGDCQQLIRAVREGRLSERAASGTHEGAYRGLVEGLNSILAAAASPIHEAKQVLYRIAERDLSARMTGAYSGDWDDIEQSLNQAADNLENALSQGLQCRRSSVDGGRRDHHRQ